MSTITNIPYSAKSMNGIIIISDGEATMENGDINANNITTDNINSNTHTVDGDLTVNGNLYCGNTSTDIHTVKGKMSFIDTLPECGLSPTIANQLINKNYCDSNFVYKSGSISETITGVKTFSSPPENSSTITTNYQLTNKIYVDTKFNSIDLSNYVTLNTAQSISGLKTFTTLPECSTLATGSNQFTNKSYVDGNFMYKTLSINEVITGVKTFNGRVVCTNANIGQSNNDLINITYADARYGRLASSNTWTQNNTFTSSLISNRNISSNLFIGSDSGLYRQSTSTNNVSLGDDSFEGNSTTVTNNTGTDNIAIGKDSLQLCEQGSFNVGIGSSALKNFITSTTTGGQLGRNVAVGYQSFMGTSSSNISRCVGLGYRAGANSIFGSQNVLIGHNVFASSSGGSLNTIIGSDVLSTAGSGQNGATIIGAQALQNATAYEQATAYGFNAGQANQGYQNIFIGPYAGNTNTTGSANLFFGQQARAIAGGETWNGLVVLGAMNALANRRSVLVLGGRCQVAGANNLIDDGRYPSVCIPNKILLQCCESLGAQASITMRDQNTTAAGAEYGEYILITSNLTTSITLPKTIAMSGAGPGFSPNYGNADPNNKPASIGMSFYFVKAYEGALTSITINAPTGQTILIEGQTTAQTSFIFDSTMRVCSFTCINFFYGTPYGNGIYWLMKSRDYNDYVNSTTNQTISGIKTFSSPIDSYKFDNSVTCIGYQVANNATSISELGTNSVLIGYQAGYSLKTAGINVSNLFIGAGAGFNMVKGADNCLIGKGAGYNLQGATTNQNNFFLGTECGGYLTRTSGSILIGAEIFNQPTMINTTDYDNNIVMGYNAFRTFTDNMGNFKQCIFLGYNLGNNSTNTSTINNNIIIGENGSVNGNYSNSVAISGKTPIINASNTFYIGDDTNTTKTILNNRQYPTQSQNSLITADTTLTFPVYSSYSINVTATATITLPTILEKHLGTEILFRRVGGTTTITVSFIGDGTQKVYNNALTGGTTAQSLMSSGVYIIRLVALVDATVGTYAWFQC